MSYHLNPKAQVMVKMWKARKTYIHPYDSEGNFRISLNGNNYTVLWCELTIQGQVLVFAGNVTKLVNWNESEVNERTASILGISTTHAKFISLVGGFFYRCSHKS